VSDTTEYHTLQQAMRSAPGAAFIDRSFSRGFSLNIFRRNAEELIEATRNVRDPDQGLRLMALENREAGLQAHREINRLVHNFVAGSKSLIDHTRQFIREHYAGTALESTYDDRVKADFASEPVAKFVQDLRNYMVHKGLPNSQMFLHFDNTSTAPGAGGELTTGVHYETSALLEWDGWTAPAKTYIREAGEHLDIHTLAESYLEQVLRFHAWLDLELQQFHTADLAQLKAMQEAYIRQFGADPARRSHQPKDQTPESLVASNELSSAPPFKFPHDVANAIDEAGKAILEKIRRIDSKPQTPDAFPSGRPVSATLTDDSMLETPTAWHNDSEGRPVVAFLISGTEVFGLDAAAYAELQPLADKVLELGWAKPAISRKFIGEVALRWLRSSFRATQQTSLASALSSASEKEVKPLDIWAPIAYLEVEESFEFGSVQIAPVTAAMIDALQAKGVDSSPSQRDEITAMFNDLRSRMQGFAAVVVHVEAEPVRAHEDGMATAQNVVGLLRFFSPVAREPRRVCTTALLGAEVIPRSQSLVLGEDNFSFSDGLVATPFHWRISKANLVALREAGLAKASDLVFPNGLGEFPMAVRAGMLLYGTGTTLHNPADRLIYTLSAVEGILLKHSMEATEFNVEERMTLLLANDKPQREEVARNVREAYRFRRRHGASVLTPHDEISLATFAHNAHIVVSIALENLHSFATKADFIDAIDRRKTTVPVQQ